MPSLAYPSTDQIQGEQELSISVTAPNSPSLTGAVCPVAALAVLEIIALRRDFFSKSATVDDIDTVLRHAAKCWKERNEPARFDQIEALYKYALVKRR